MKCVYLFIYDVVFWEPARPPDPICPRRLARVTVGPHIVYEGRAKNSMFLFFYAVVSSLSGSVSGSHHTQTHATHATHKRHATIHATIHATHVTHVTHATHNTHDTCNNKLGCSLGPLAVAWGHIAVPWVLRLFPGSPGFSLGPLAVPWSPCLYPGGPGCSLEPLAVPWVPLLFPGSPGCSQGPPDVFPPELGPITYFCIRQHSDK